MSESLVSVIVPIYNASPYLEQCLDSIVEQTHKNLKIILLNDGSTDNSLATIQRCAAQDKRIKIIDKHKTKATTPPATAAWPRQPAPGFPL